MTPRHRSPALAPWRSWSGLSLAAAGTFAAATATTMLVGSAFAPDEVAPVAAPPAPARVVPSPGVPIVAPEPTEALVADVDVRSPAPAATTSVADTPDTPDTTASAAPRTAKPTSGRSSSSPAKGPASLGGLLAKLDKVAGNNGNGKGKGRGDG